MNKKLLLSIVGILIIGGAAVLLFKRPASSPAPPVTTPTSDMSSTVTGSGQPEAKPVATNTVDIKDMAFSPTSITVKKGTSVTWTNHDSAQHTVTPDDETAEFQSSPTLSQGQTYSVTFNTAGTFTYHCTFHSDMKATVIVTE